MDEWVLAMRPFVESAGGGSLSRAAGRLFHATRPRFFAASIIPLLVGTAWGQRMGGGLDLGVFALALLAVLCVHAGANVLNDVFDGLSGSDWLNRDRIPPYTGGSRFIQDGIMSTAQMARWGAVLLLLAVPPGVALVLEKGAGVLLFGLAGIAVGVLYSAPPANLSARGLGETAVGASFGVLPVMGAAWLQGAALGFDALLLSAPITFWIAAILLVNEVPDARADAAVGRRTLAVRMGPHGARRLYRTLHLAAPAAIVILVLRGAMPVWGLALPAILALVAMLAARGIDTAPGKRRRLKRAIEITLAIHALGGLWLAAAVWSG